MKTRTRWILAALIVLLLPVLFLMPLTKAQAAGNSPGLWLRAAIAQLMSQAPGQQVAATNDVPANRSSAAARAKAARLQAMAGSQLPTSSGPTAGTVGIPPMPESPQVVLYDQYDNAGAAASLSATFTDFPTFSSDLADDFVVPAGQTWSVESVDADGVYFNGAGPADSFNVFFYTDNAGLPGAQVYAATNQPFTQLGSTFTVPLTVPAALTAGTYWVEAQANMTFGTEGEWGWTDRTVQSNNTAAWQNPGGGFGLPACVAWNRKLTCIPTASGPDQVFRLNGTLVVGTPTPPTATPTPTPTPVVCDTGLIVNGGFETGSFPPWVIDGTNATPVVTNTQSHSGTFSAFAGDAPNGFCGFPLNEALGDSSFYQQFTVPAGGGTLSFWHRDCTTDSITFDWQDAYITDSSGTILQTIFHQASDAQIWINTTVDMAPYAGQTVRIKFLVHEDGFGDLTGMYVDDVVLLAACVSPTPTPTSTPTSTPTPTPTPTNTPTPTPTVVTGNQGCGAGYWKQPQHFDSWCASYTTDTPVSTVFDTTDCGCNFSSLTFLEALQGAGFGNTLCDAQAKLFQQGVAALLNACPGSGVAYPLTTAQIISEVNTALQSCNRTTILNEATRLSGFNNRPGGCPLH